MDRPLVLKLKIVIFMPVLPTRLWTDKHSSGRAGPAGALQMGTCRATPSLLQPELSF